MESSVRERYSAAAQEREAALCCPVDYNPEYLRVIPEEVIERDYGCGDPSRYVREGDVVLDLGSGGGKICFIAAQLVGPKGRVIGVDMNDDMLELARRSAPAVAERIGYSNVEFHRGKIQDLELDIDRVDHWLRQHPVTSAAGLVELDQYTEGLRQREPMIPTGSIDVVVSNCVLNLVRAADKPKLIREIFRVLKRGGRIAISDIVSDEAVPAELQQDPELWSGCISGAFFEEELLRELETAGFYGIAISSWESTPFRTVQGIEFRSITVTAYKGKEGACFEANQAVIYRGPWKLVEDDDGHVLRRGDRVAVCAKTFDIMTRGPYAQDIVAIEPLVTLPEDERALFDCTRTHRRHPRESKGLEYDATSAASACCEPGECC
jgi:ubiquinone/menaquinone biosynthesis C-methylase UbiE